MKLGPRGAAVLALGALGGTAVAAYLRVFTGAGWLGRALVAAWLPIALVLGLRRVGLGRWTSAAATLLLGVVAVPNLLAPLGGGVDRLALIGQVARAIASAVAAIDTTFTPAAPGTGLLGLLLCAAWACGVAGALFLGEQGPPLAAVPPVVLVVFAAVVGTGGHRLAVAVPFLVSLLALLYTEAWSRGPGRPARPPGVAAAAGSAAVALVLAVATPVLAAGFLEGGPRLGSDDSGTTVISPIVQILPRLNDPTPRVMFTVEAEQPAYWKLASLDRFDGKAWSSSGEYRPVRGTVDIDDPPGRRITTLRQRYTIRQLGGIWVPAAYAPARVSGIEVSVDTARGTLATDALRRGQTYTVVSEIPAPAPQFLRQTGTAGAPEGSTRLPADLPPLIGGMAAALTRNAPTAYDKALAIQSFLRTFDYRQDIPAGHSGNYLVHFLTELRAGYCEQFAGSMAVMLRTLGIPSRVAVGFLPGEASADGFVVGNEQAHSWPEVWFRDVGWVAFEPTPRAGVGPPSHAAPVTRPTQPIPSPATSPSPQSTGAASPRPTGAASPGALPGPRPTQRHARPVWTTAGLALAGMLGLTRVARAVRLRGWVLLARSPSARIFSAWNELVLRGADAWRPRRRTETEREYARAMVGALGIDYALLEPLVAARQQAAYASRSPGRTEAEAAHGSLRVLRRRILIAAAWPARLRLLLSPAPLFRSG